MPDLRTQKYAVVTQEPELVVTGHGRAMHSAAMRQALQTLARDSDRLAVPEHGRFVDAPQRAEDGSAYR